MITTVTLNPAIDKTLTIEDFELNKVNRVSKISEGLGGKGINVSKVLNYLGTKNIAIGFIGEKNYSRVKSLNLVDPIDTDFVLVDANTRTNTKIIDPNSHDTTDINEAGFEVNTKHIEQMQTLISNYSKQSEYIIFSGSLCQGMSQDIYQNLLKRVDKNCRLVVDADGEMLKTSLLESPFLIKPNIHELERLLNQKLKSSEEIVDACKTLILKYQIQYILVSLGEEGSMLVSKDNCLKANALKVEVVSTVAAGDSMLAAFLSNYKVSKNTKEALRYGACAGSLAVCDTSTDIFKTKTIEEVIHKIAVSNCQGEKL